MKRRRVLPPGDDVVPVPAPVDEEPPPDRYCDLVMTGGIASGVVYPWAIVELARAYRFRNIGGTSVGAMAAALAAAAEYGRRTGADAPFETLRRLPAALGEDVGDGRTRMLSLFQTRPAGRRLIKLWGRLGSGNPEFGGHRRSERFCRVCSAALALAACVRARCGLRRAAAEGAAATATTDKPPPQHALCRVVVEVAGVYAGPLALGALAGGVLAVLLGIAGHLIATLLTLLLGALVGVGLSFWRDISQGLIANLLGLCPGATLEPQHADPDKATPGLCEWLHEGIQHSAGLDVDDRPLSFRDLWSAPAYPGAPPSPCSDADPPERRAINLQMITTNVTHGRPYRLPLDDATSRLFFRPKDLEAYLPPAVLKALVAAAVPYAPRSVSDPGPSGHTAGFLELPGADMPVLVAARLSLSFPLLFAALPLYAIDYEKPRKQRRRLKRCLFTDGGVSSNFPMHLFDAALPRWPTFGLWLDKQDAYPAPADPTDTAARPAKPRESDVWLAEFHDEGWGDNWERFDPCAAADPQSANGSRSHAAIASDTAAACAAGRVPLLAFLLAVLRSTLDWRDRVSLRLPHVRNRVARLMLRPDEGGLHIGMPRAQILDMAHRYGSKAGRLFVERFSDQDGQQAPAWREQRWVRLQLLINGLRERLDGLAASAAHAAHCLPMTEAIARSGGEPPLRDRERERLGQSSLNVPTDQARSLEHLLGELERLEERLRGAAAQDYQPRPEPEMRLRAPL